MMAHTDTMPNHHTCISSCDCRTGTYVRKPELPYTPGADAAGVVEAVGEGVQGVAVGERVYLAGAITGTYASQALCTPAQLHKLPDNVSFEQGAGVLLSCAL